MNFNGLNPGDRVVVRVYAGMGMNGPEYKEATGTVQRLLCFPTHVVLNMGGKFGTAQVCDETNFVRVARRASA